MSLIEAKAALDSLIKKSRVHLYKPIQIAEILYRDRVVKDIDLVDLTTYRNSSKNWRNLITDKFVGRSSNSSARYQDDVFNETAIPPRLLVFLGEENRLKNGAIEAYIYKCFIARFSQMSMGLQYCLEHDKTNFNVNDYINLFWHNAGLKRSIDKIYEIIVYSLFSVLVEALEVMVTISINDKKVGILEEFEDFTKMVIGLSSKDKLLNLPAKIYRVGVTNAADRGLDMYANFGMAIQIKHLSLTSELAENIVGSIEADRIVIVCKASEQAIIVSLLNQIGWKSRIQSIITEKELEDWYERALRGAYAAEIGDKIIATLQAQIISEFPASNNKEFMSFYEGRGYNILSDNIWI
ncbi:MAG: HaeII family restriction endonuclease [Rickettsiales bacterium]